MPAFKPVNRRYDFNQLPSTNNTFGQQEQPLEMFNQFAFHDQAPMQSSLFAPWPTTNTQSHTAWDKYDSQ